METLREILDVIFKTPIPNLLIVAGIIFILIGILGNVFKKLKIDDRWRIASFFIGIVILSLGMIIKINQKEPPNIMPANKTEVITQEQSNLGDEKILPTEQKLPYKANACKKLNILKTTEAEDCPRSGWQDWAEPEFSEGLLINNESPNQRGRATNANLDLNFEGTGVIIVYRQDTWYGILTVEIDGKEVGFINQRGNIIKNKAEKCFEAGEMGKHFLVLRGSSSSGVVTIDAIKILGD